MRPAMEAFYRALSDEQKQRFNALDTNPVQDATAEASQGNADPCGRPAGGRATGQLDRASRRMRLTDAQQEAMRSLQDAWRQAAAIVGPAGPISR